MKLIFVALTALLCGANAYPSIFDGPQCQAPSGGLMPTIKEVIALVPLDKVVEIYMVAISNDKEVQEVMEFVQSDDFIKIVTAVNKHSNFHKLMKYACDELYLDAYYYLNIAHEYLGWPAIERPTFTSKFARSGFLGMLEDILEVIPTEKIVALMKEKVKSDEYVKKAVEMMSSNDFKALVKTVTDMPEYQFLEGELRKMGAPVEKIIEFLQKFFGWD
ncbi:uncharacterized protein LOC129612465 [Condylostylus longicornis]|uniref:uncharacterized protein LOC129612465 n=1 Tax=Condylostylus longicornis TaxID=2530218 RepID=UPI00244E119B|nr:uncharacterized protein LOC129612465 [Condylostylus longicornis]